MKPYLLLFDIDWTLCEMNDSATPYNHTGEDTPIHSTCVLLQAVIHSFQKMGTANNFRVGILTARKEKAYKEVTRKWFDYYFPEVFKYPFLEFHMQQGSVADKAHIFKERRLQELQEQFDIIWIIEDDENMVEVCRKLKVPLYLFHNNA